MKLKTFDAGPLVIRLGLLFLVALHAFASPYPPDGTWGVVGVLGFRPVLRFVLLVGCGILLIPAVARVVLAWGRLFWARAGRHIAAVPLWVWVLLLLSLGWLFRCQIPYGDAQEMADEIQRGQLINYKQPLDRLITSLLYRSGYGLFGWDAATAIAIINTAVGAFFWLGLWRFVWRRKVFADTPGWIVIGLLGTTGVTQLLFGYVENYTLLTVGCLWTLMLCLDSLRHREHPIWPAALAYGLTFASHLAAAWLAPALITTWAWRQKTEVGTWWKNTVLRRKAIREALVGFIVAAMPIVLIGAGMLYFGKGLQDFSFTTFGGGDGVMFVPLTKLSTPYERFTMLSVPHLKAVLNQLLLVAPVGAVFALLGWTLRRYKGPRAEPGFWVLFAGMIGPVIYAFIFNPDLMVFFPDLGPMAEWDLLCLEAIPITLFGVWWLKSADDNPGGVSELALPALAISGFHLVGWLLFNAGFRV